MRQQQQVWQEEHMNGRTLPSMANLEPTTGVYKFIGWLEQHQKLSGKAIDIGSGKGRNSVFLASVGFEVYAMEYIGEAVRAALMLSKEKNTANRTHFIVADIDKKWDFPDHYFDVAIDSFSSIDIETKQGRELCRDEMYRTLKVGGVAMVTVCSIEDEWEKDLIVTHPGPEKNSTYWPQNGKFQKDYDKAELYDFYKTFDIVAFDRIKKPAIKLGRKGTAVNYWMVLQKS